MAPSSNQTPIDRYEQWRQENFFKKMTVIKCWQGAKNSKK